MNSEPFYLTRLRLAAKQDKKYRLDSVWYCIFFFFEGLPCGIKCAMHAYYIYVYSLLCSMKSNSSEVKFSLLSNSERFRYFGSTVPHALTVTALKKKKRKEERYVLVMHQRETFLPNHQRMEAAEVCLKYEIRGFARDTKCFFAPLSL